jgi:hypothetical protein
MYRRCLPLLPAQRAADLCAKVGADCSRACFRRACVARSSELAHGCRARLLVDRTRASSGRVRSRSAGERSPSGRVRSRSGGERSVSGHEQSPLDRERSLPGCQRSPCSRERSPSRRELARTGHAVAPADVTLAADRGEVAPGRRVVAVEALDRERGVGVARTRPTAPVSRRVHVAPDTHAAGARSGMLACFGWLRSTILLFFGLTVASGASSHMNTAGTRSSGAPSRVADARCGALATGDPPGAADPQASGRFSRRVHQGVR